MREPDLPDVTPSSRVHAIVTDPRNDYGEDWLERHHAESHPQDEGGREGVAQHHQFIAFCGSPHRAVSGPFSDGKFKLRHDPYAIQFDSSPSPGPYWNKTGTKRDRAW